MSQSVKKGHLAIVVLLIVSALFVLVYRWIPERRLVLMPHPEGTYYLYDDSGIGGANTASWVNADQHHWRCRREATLESQFCGFNLALGHEYSQGIDFSDYSELVLALDYRTQADLITVFLRNFNPAYSTLEDGNSAQYIQFVIRPEDREPELRIDFSEFSLADWWMNQRKLERPYRSPEFNNITLLGINMGSNLPAGNNDIVIKHIALTGPWFSEKHWYLGIIVFFWSGTLLYLIFVSVTHRKKAIETAKKYENLADEHKNLYDKTQVLTEISRRDGLSGLLNRYGLAQAIEQWHIPSVAPVSLVMFDIDHFKRINDRRGHLEGDKVICRVAEILHNHSREQDVLSRWGGEEFLLVLPHTSTQQAHQVGEKIRQRIFNDEYFTAKKLTVTISLGIAAMGSEQSFEHALRRADDCLYRAKAMGRNCSVVETEDV
ncbi:GGDEF domain-containing protein [Gilvimarinus sp. SDUM040013]|uniref:GGDEF domain-containing protein n=1 Tax=Gilvimarinus gilvus TaxID=3058038 RepID=UPI002673A18C|nr:GGDEF domain-containing protein [Gilvimarinus sp. SDUM040013]MDO3387702.1 GGDEF domain-containing protein [Gilvimarinus sp. SDUM040013]